MKKSIYFIRICVFFFAFLLITGSVFAQKTIVIVYDPAKLDPVSGENPDIAMMQPVFEDAGYTVELFPTYNLSALSPDELNILNNADLVYAARFIGSGNFSSPNKEFYNAITAPLITFNMWALRISRMNWFNTETCTNVDVPVEEIFQGEIIEAQDSVFAGLESIIDWWSGPHSTITIPDAGNGKIMAINVNTGTPIFVRFEAGIEFYEGSIDMPAGERVFFGAASDNMKDESGNTIFNYFSFTDPIKQVFLKEVARLTKKDAVGINQKNFNSKLMVYPNPAINQIMVEMNQLEKVEIFDLSGRKIYSAKATANKLSVDASSFSTGMYFVKASDTMNNVASKLFTKE